MCVYVILEVDFFALSCVSILSLMIAISHMPKQYEVLIVGGGLVGLTAAFVLGKTGMKTALCAPKNTNKDPRTTALLDGSVNFLTEHGLWQDLKPSAHPLKIMRLVDATNRLFRFQQTDFRSVEIGLDAFGYNLRNADVIDLLEQKLADMENVMRIHGSFETLKTTDDQPVSATIALEGGKTEVIKTRFVVGADGKNSKVRDHFAHGVRNWSYPQSALVLDFKHEIASEFTSTEFHTETGPFTFVPQTPNRAGLVWLETPERAQEIAGLDKPSLNLLIEEKMQSCLGKIAVVSEPHQFSMAGLTANRFGDHNHALVGEAAHVFPPIGAQGFNLGIRDIKELSIALGRFASFENLGHQYHLKRAGDINTRTIGVDMLNRSLLSDFLPVQIARTAGMHLLANILPLRKQAMKLGLSPLQFK